MLNVKVEVLSRGLRRLRGRAAKLTIGLRGFPRDQRPIRVIRAIRGYFCDYLRQVIEDHQMGFLEDMVVCPIRWGLNEVLRDSDVHPL